MASRPRLLRPGLEFPTPPVQGGCAPRTSPNPPGWSWLALKRRNNTGSSRIPSRLAHRARPIRQYRDDATLSRLLPPSPPTRGSGCLQLHPAATTARRSRSSTSIRANSASWRTITVTTGTIIGVPTGIALGRFLWDLFARQINVVPQPAIPAMPVILISFGALALANIVAAVPGRIAARTPTALLLRAE